MENEVQQQNDAGEVAHKPEKKRNKVARGFGIFGIVLLVIILIVLTVNALLTMFMDDYYTTFGDYRLFSIVSDSMEPTIPKGSMIVAKKPKSESEIKASTTETAKDGTVITFKVKTTDGETILLTHRVTAISKNAAGKTVFTTRGDNADGVDRIKPTMSDIVGIYTGKKCGFFGSLFGFFASALGTSVLIFFLFIIVVAWVTIHYVNKTEARKALENAALKKSSEALGNVNLRYDNIHEITAVMDVLGMVTVEPRSHAESKMVAERLNEFIKATSLELPQTPETAAILDSLPAPDTPGSLAAALSAGATLRQAEDGQTLVLTTMSGDKHIFLTPVNTPDGIILCQQGVRIKSDVAPNIESLGIASMPTIPEFFEGQPLEKNAQYPELPQPGVAIGPDVLLGVASMQDITQQLPAAQQLAELPQANEQDQPRLEAGTQQKQPASEPPQEPHVPTQKPKKPRRQATPEELERRRQAALVKRRQNEARKAYQQYREMAAQLELKQAEQLHGLLAETAPLTPEEQLRVAEYRAANPPKPKKTRKPLTDEQKAKRKAAAERRKQKHEEFLNALTPEDRELYLTEQKLAKSRAATIRQLKRIEADRKLLGKLE